jgi:hypothetical protein
MVLAVGDFGLFHLDDYNLYNSINQSRETESPHIYIAHFLAKL